MAAEDESNGPRCNDTGGYCSTFIASLLHESAEQKGGRPMKYKGSWCLSLC